MAHTILVVDDDDDFLLQMRLQLQARGYEVVTAASAAEARAALAARRPDLVIADLMMEVPDAGFSLCYEIKRQDPTIPVIMATAVGSATGISFDVETEEERAWIKADSVLPKPLRVEQLEREMRRLLKDQD